MGLYVWISIYYHDLLVVYIQSVAKKTGPPEKNGFLDFELLYLFIV